jgi:hypothetical protein
MSGDTEVDDPEVSEGASENEYSEHEQEEPDAVGREEDDNTDMAEQKFRPDGEENGKAGSAVTTKPKLDPKDPLRPRRKKARRACFACQRAHLTCGMFVCFLLFGRTSAWPLPWLHSAYSVASPNFLQVATNTSYR